MRAFLVACACGLLTVGVPGTEGRAQNAASGPTTPELKGVTADTLSVSLAVLQNLAISEPDIAAPDKTGQPSGVLLKVLVSKTGTVDEAVALFGADNLARVAIQGVKAWKYRPYLVDGVPRQIQSTIALGFADGVGRRLPPPPQLKGVTADTVRVTDVVLERLAVSTPDISARDEAPQPSVVSLKVLVSKTGTVEEAVVTYGPGELPRVAIEGVKSWTFRPFVLDGKPREFQSVVMLRFADGVGKWIRPSAGVPGMVGVAEITGLGSVAGDTMQGGAAAGPPPVAQEAQSGAVSVSAGVVAGLLYHAEPPVYPPIAKAAHVEGMVVLRAILSKQGTVEDLQVISGPPMLVGAAVEAVRKWRYKPYLLNGEPTEVQTTINVNFVFAPSPKPAPGPGSVYAGDEPEIP